MNYKLFAFIAALLLPISIRAFDTGLAEFAVGINNEIYPYREFATFVLPGERMVIRILDESGLEFSLEGPASNLQRSEAKRWVWHAPSETRRAELKIRRADGETITLAVFVLVPASRMRDGKLNGITIGKYPPPLRGEPLYAPPDGFIEVRKEDLSQRVSPHFVLGQFVPATGSDYPRYIVLKERLLLALEALLTRLNQRGHTAESLAIISGYRSPELNRAAGGSQYSRHIYGGAASVIVDRDPADGFMDDLDGDGLATSRDAAILFDIADKLFTEPQYRHLVGGLAVYPETDRRGPFLHLDVRGYRARWRGDEDRVKLPSPRKAKHPRDFVPPR